MELCTRIQQALDEESSSERLLKLNLVNTDLESLWNSPPEQQINRSEPADTLTVAEVSSRVHERLVGAVCASLSSENSDEGVAQSNWPQICLNQEQAASGDKGSSSPSIDPSTLEDVKSLVRTGKNWLRWILQMFAAFGDPTSNTAAESLTNPMILRWCWIVARQTGKGDPEFASYAGQWIFYGLYSLPPEDLLKQEEWQQDGFLSELLVECIAAQSVSLGLSFVRITHLLAATSKQARMNIGKLRIDELADSSMFASWIRRGEDSDAWSFSRLWKDIVIFSQNSSSATEANDKLPYLLLEVLRCQYALAEGSRLVADEDVSKALVCLLSSYQAPVSASTLRPDEVTIQVKSSVISLLSDADPEIWAESLVSTIPSVIALLSNQMDGVLDNRLVDDRSAAAVVPHLTFLYKNCSNTSFWNAVHEFVFPSDRDAEFQRLVESNASAKNMEPLDAPKGTLRYKLIQLVTWPQSQVKRLTGELLWSLCRKDAVEFTYRVGMGNALPTLNLKGIVELPNAVHSS